MKKIKKLINAFAPPIVWALIIFLLSSRGVLPGLEISSHDFVFKKMAHMFVYFVLYLLSTRAIEITVNKKNLKQKLIIPIIICLIYAFSDEFHQSLVPGRYPTLRDVGYDMLGVGIAFLKKYDFI